MLTRPHPYKVFSLSTADTMAVMAKVLRRELTEPELERLVSFLTADTDGMGRQRAVSERLKQDRFSSSIEEDPHGA